MIKISHEVPLELMERSLLFNDYQYCLVHLLEKYPTYLNHFKKCRDQNMPVLLDNSLFELGEAFSGEQFAKWIRELQPNQYVIPDVFGDVHNTLANAAGWINGPYGSEFDHLSSIGVLQGSSYEEYKYCYESLDALGVDIIAISFGYGYYTDKMPHVDKNQARMMGRVNLINRLISDGVINHDKEHHLLGAGLPQEFMFYNEYKFNFISQLDTSSPIVHGIHEIEYMEGGLIHKEELKLADQMEVKLSASQEYAVSKNIAKFRKLVNS